MGPGGQSPFSTMDPSRQQQAGSYQSNASFLNLCIFPFTYHLFLFVY